MLSKVHFLSGNQLRTSVRCALICALSIYFIKIEACLTQVIGSPNA